MARQRNDAREAQHEPTWANVSECIEAIEGTYAGHVQVVMDIDGARVKAGALWVRVMLFRDFQVQGQRPVDVVADLWPTVKHRTMTGLIFRMLHQLDHVAEARTRAESEGLPF